MKCQQLSQITRCFGGDIIAVRVEPALLSYRERVRITSTRTVAGFRRLYCDGILPASIPTDWPHHVLVSVDVLDRILVDGVLPLNFTDFVARCSSCSLDWFSFRVGGTVLDLETEEGLLSFLAGRVNSLRGFAAATNASGRAPANYADGCTISAKARIFGKVLLGSNVFIDDNAVVVGPAILGDNVTVASAAVIKSSIISPGISIAKGRFVQNRILAGPESEGGLSFRRGAEARPQLNQSSLPTGESAVTRNRFRTWSRFSYARCLKRIGDITASLGVLILFAPVLPIIALAIKLSSPGPVFFNHKRQGLHGKEFTCLKFRTMIMGAEKIQHRLRFKNEADGPQFKLDDDPRVTFVGRFLRETFIDEIPQFINILAGQMSVVGPRPSPREENSCCAFWRDARLSVRPGITGLWQVQRTRRAGHDFQEWIHYDVQYVRGISLRLDLSICWQTAKKLVASFINQF